MRIMALGGVYIGVPLFRESSIYRYSGCFLVGPVK